MWYKVEIDNEGGIKSCVEVEASVAQGRHVRYVEADSRADAIKLVQQWYRHAERSRRNTNERMRVAKLTGRCRSCMQPRGEGCTAVYCRTCADRRAERARERFAGAPAINAPRAKTDEERAATLSRSRKGSAGGRKRSDLLVGGGSPKGAVYRKLAEVLAKLDSTTPRAFRAWLVAEIARLAPRKSILQEVIEQHPELAHEKRPAAAE